jgi:hypothetical protein
MSCRKEEMKKKYGAEFIGPFWLVLGGIVYRLIGRNGECEQQRQHFGGCYSDGSFF